MRYAALLTASASLAYLLSSAADARPGLLQQHLRDSGAASPPTTSTPPKPASSAGSASYLSAVTAPSAFPTSAWSSYYEAPTGTLMEPRPAVTNGVKGGPGGYFPDDVANPSFLPTGAPSTEAVYPVASSSPAPPPGSIAADFSQQVQRNISALITANATSSCDICLQSLAIGQKLARAYPEQAPDAMISLCKQFQGGSALKNQTCERKYAPSAYGSSYTQLLSYADVTSPESTDGRYICAYVLPSACPAPTARELSTDWLDGWFGSAGRLTPDWVVKRGLKQQAKLAGEAAREPVRVAHLSDIHVDPRFLVNSEAGCTNGQCCRADSYNSTLVKTPPNSTFTQDGNVQLSLTPQQIVEPAVYWGNYHCDSPWSLAVSAISSVKRVIQLAAGKSKRSDKDGDKLSFILYTGDMVTHESGAPWHLSRELVWYTQQAIFDSFHRWLGPGPTYSAIGNHDSVPSDFASPNNLPDGRGKQFSWDWNNVARLFKKEGWITDPEDLKEVRTHYAGYSVKHGSTDLRIITLNTDMWYRGNHFAFINSTSPDFSGMLRFLTDELTAAELANEKVWIVGHVLTGWSGTNPLDNPSNLFYQIVSRFAPWTIKGIFFGHTHEDQFNVFYHNNGTTRATRDAASVAFIGPSVTPGNNVNPSFRIYDVDPASWEVMDVHQYYAQLADFKALPSTTDHGPVWRKLYSARETYGNFSASLRNGSYAAPVQLAQSGDSSGIWPVRAPLNASFWAAVTDEMEVRPQLVETFNELSGRNSSRSPTCTSNECVQAKICYMRSGSGPLGKECPQGYDSVQSGNYH